MSLFLSVFFYRCLLGKGGVPFAVCVPLAVGGELPVLPKDLLVEKKLGRDLRSIVPFPTLGYEMRGLSSQSRVTVNTTW